MDYLSFDIYPLDAWFLSIFFIYTFFSFSDFVFSFTFYPAEQGWDTISILRHRASDDRGSAKWAAAATSALLLKRPKLPLLSQSAIQLLIPSSSLSFPMCLQISQSVLSLSHPYQQVCCCRTESVHPRLLCEGGTRHNIAKIRSFQASDW